MRGGFDQLKTPLRAGNCLLSNFDTHRFPCGFGVLYGLDRLPRDTDRLQAKSANEPNRSEMQAFIINYDMDGIAIIHQTDGKTLEFPSVGRRVWLPCWKVCFEGLP